MTLKTVVFLSLVADRTSTSLVYTTHEMQKETAFNGKGKLLAIDE